MKDRDISKTAEQRAKAGFELVAPSDIADRDDMDRAHKIALLEQWEQDLREQMVAEEENMTGDGDAALADTLQDVIRTLERLGAKHQNPPVPSKHG